MILKNPRSSHVKFLPTLLPIVLVYGTTGYDEAGRAQESGTTFLTPPGTPCTSIHELPDPSILCQLLAQRLVDQRALLQPVLDPYHRRTMQAKCSRVPFERICLLRHHHLQIGHGISHPVDRMDCLSCRRQLGLSEGR